MKSSTLARPTCQACPRAHWLFFVSLALFVLGIWQVDGVIGAIGLAGLALLATARLIGKRNLAGLTIALDAPHRATEDMAFPMRISIANPRRWLDATSVRLAAEFPGAAKLAFHTPWIAAGSAADYDGHATPQLRGEGDGVRISAVSSYPLGFFTCQSEVIHPHRMRVLPRARAPRDRRLVGVMHHSSPRGGAAMGHEDGDLRGLRPWQSGDRPKRIAWPSTLRAIARGEPPLVRETDPPGFLPRQCLVVIHSHASGGTLIRPGRFEETLRLASGWLDHLHALGIPARITADFDGWSILPAKTRADIVKCREMLAQARRCPSTEAHELHRTITQSAGPHDTIILLSDMPAASWAGHVPDRSPACLIPHF